MHLSTGDMLRAEITAGTDLGKKMSSIMATGELVPDEVVIEMIAAKIDKTKNSAGFLFDGFPRTVGQTIELEKMLGKRGMKIDQMLVLDVEHDELVKRLESKINSNESFGNRMQYLLGEKLKNQKQNL